MITTLNKIKEYHPSFSGWEKLLKSLNKTEAGDEPLSLEYILESNGIKDAVWALCCFDYKECCLFNADVAESVLHIFEDKYPKDKRPREAIEGIRLFHQGLISGAELKKRSYATYANAYPVSVATTVSATSYLTAIATVTADNGTYSDRANKWKEIELLFIKHFCQGDKQ